MIVSENRVDTINILLAIRQEFLRNGVKSFFVSHDDIQVVGELDSFENLADTIKVQLPEIVIISTDERNSPIFDYAKTIIASNPEVSVIMMLENFEDELIYAALGSSVSSCLTVEVQADELIACIRKVSHGEYPIFDMLTRPGIARLIIKDMESDLYSDNTGVTDTRKTLSDREREILSLIANGNTMEHVVSNINSTENDIYQNLTEIYAKLVFNNFCEFSTQSSENAGLNDQTPDNTSTEDTAEIRKFDNHYPEQSRESEVSIHDNHVELPPSVWDGFEALKQELQETLDRLAPPEIAHANIPEEEPLKILDYVEEDNEAIADDVEPSSEVITANHDRETDDIEVADGFNISIPDAEKVNKESSGIGEDNNWDVENTDESLNTQEETLPINDHPSIEPARETYKYAIHEVEESHIVPHEKLDTTSELSEEENTKLKKQKKKWFRFSLKRDDKTDLKKEIHDENETTDDKEVPGKPEPLPTGVSGLENDNKNVEKKIKVEGKNTSQKDGSTNQEYILSSIKKLGMVISIQPPVNIKQLEVFESVLKKTDGINVLLHKGTAGEHFLIISGQDRSYLLNSLRNISFVENPRDENEIISLKLLPVNETD